MTFHPPRATSIWRRTAHRRPIHPKQHASAMRRWFGKRRFAREEAQPSRRSAAFGDDDGEENPSTRRFLRSVGTHVSGDNETRHRRTGYRISSRPRTTVGRRQATRRRWRTPARIRPCRAASVVVGTAEMAGQAAARCVEADERRADYAASSVGNGIHANMNEAAGRRNRWDQTAAFKGRSSGWLRHNCRPTPHRQWHKHIRFGEDDPDSTIARHVRAVPTQRCPPRRPGSLRRRRGGAWSARRSLCRPRSGSASSFIFVVISIRAGAARRQPRSHGVAPGVLGRQRMLGCPCVGPRRASASDICSKHSRRALRHRSASSGCCGSRFFSSSRYGASRGRPRR